MTLVKETRDAIGRTVRSLRMLFEDEFGKQASGRFGIRSTARVDAEGDGRLDAWLDPIESLSLTPAEFAQRDELVHALRYLTSEGHVPGEAVARLVREAAFTAVNRLLALRVAEAIGALPAVLSAGRQSAGYRETVGDLFPGLAHAEDGYWIYVQVAGDELAPGVPRLFDRRHPTSAFVPSRACVDEALELLTADELDGAWVEPETLGWGYQFFNGDDVKQMRDASSAPRTSRELAVRNQFFTPRYVVDWLVQNTLGRRLVQAGYDLELPLMVGEVGDHEPLALEEVRVFDPAVGSGHFLLGSYDLLEQAWQSTGVPPAGSAAKILPCLFGVDIDPRAAQVAQAVLLLRARGSVPTAALIAPTIVTAVPLPQSMELRQRAFGGLSPAARHLADEITEALDQAPLLGSLLKVEQHLEQELVSHQTEPRLAQDGDEANVLNELHHALDELVSTAASPEQRMFTAEASDALRFLEICQQRYDAVLMNPPFGASVHQTKPYLKAEYGPASVDLYAAFVTRGHQLLRSGGHVGAITNRTGFFLKSFTDWRAETVLPVVACVADLGLGVLHDALVEAAAYVLSRDRASSEIVFRSLLREADKAVLADPSGGRRWDRHRSVFGAMPNQTLSYWVPDSIARTLATEPTVGGVANVKAGLCTGNDFRFIRLWWETAPWNGDAERRWVPLAKGGDYSPYYRDLDLVVDWGERDAMSEYPGCRLQNTDSYFKAGLTWSLRTASALAIRPLPAEAIFSHKGGFLDHPTPGAAAAWANSSPSRYFADTQLAAGETTSSGGAARSYEIGIVASLPYPGSSPDRLDKLGRELCGERAMEASSDETSPWFHAPRSSPRSALNGAEETLERCAEIDRIVATALGLDDLAMQAIAEETGPAVVSYSPRAVVDRDEVLRLYSMPMAKLIEHVLGKKGGARHLAMKTYMFDRRVELLCHLFEAHPRVVVDAIGEAQPPGAKRDHAEQLISYLMGVAFGRWDCRLFKTEPEPFDPWAPLPRRPPAMLDSQGTGPAHQYPIELPPEPLLPHDSASPWDVKKRVAAAAEAVGVDQEGLVGDLGSDDIQKYVRDKFFGEHLSRYSGSRRYAPIYWQLAVPSKRWGLWLYAPSMSRESLFSIARAASEKLSTISEQIGFAVERAVNDRAARERYEALEDLAAEIEKFSAIADEVAQSGWAPDLNDGFVLNAAPLEALFVDKKWRGQIAKHRKAMQKGEYAWATVQRQYFEKRT